MIDLVPRGKPKAYKVSSTYTPSTHKSMTYNKNIDLFKDEEVPNILVNEDFTQIHTALTESGGDSNKLTKAAFRSPISLRVNKLPLPSPRDSEINEIVPEPQPELLERKLTADLTVKWKGSPIPHRKIISTGKKTQIR